MNSKRLLTTLAALLCGATLASAEIAIKDRGDGQVDITFTYKEDAAPEMAVIGSFDNWTVPGEGMTKNGAGLWEKTIQVGNADVITYKFYSKGSWIFDERAPDKKDDGYGGSNGLIPVADILSGLLPAIPGEAPLPPPKGAPKVATRPKLTFGTTTFVESSTNYASSGLVFQDTGLTAKSIWKFQGDFVPGMPGYLEVTAFDAAPRFASRNGLEIDEGLESLAAGVIFNPFYYLGGNKRPALDKVRFGFDTPYLSYETGYGKAPLPLHQSLFWKTVSKDIDSGDGYSAFLLGPKAKNWGDVTLDAGFVPNKSQSGAYGAYAWVNAEAYGTTLDAQYDVKSAAATDLTQYFNNPVRQDILFGAESILDWFVIRGQLLSSSFTKGSSADLRPAREKVAYKVAMGYKDYYDETQAFLSYATRGGAAAQLLYLNDDDTLAEIGAAGTQTIGLDGHQRFGYWGDAKWETSVTLQTSQPANKDVSFRMKPGFMLDFDKFPLVPLVVDAYAIVRTHSLPSSIQRTAGFDGAGAKATWTAPAPTIRKLDVFYRSDLPEGKQHQHSLLTEATLAGGLVLQGGTGLRAGTAGFLLGASFTLPVPEAKSPSLYAQAVYNLDPYDADGKTAFDLTDEGPTKGGDTGAGAAALRLGIYWNY